MNPSENIMNSPPRLYTNIPLDNFHEVVCLRSLELIFDISTVACRMDVESHATFHVRMFGVLWQHCKRAIN